MDLGNQRASGNVEDRRGMGMVGGGLGVGGIVVALVAYFLGVDPRVALNMAEQVTAPQHEARQATKGTPTDQMGQFVSKVLGSTEDVWTRIFRQSGSQYRAPTLVLYDGQVRSACGMGQAAMGPFYCPSDEKLYIDLSFYRDLQTRFRAPGDFAQAYVIAHEVGHHVQKLMGITDKVDNARRRMGESQFNALSVRLELQADCFAGIWANKSEERWHLLQPGDVEAALRTASAIGDDTLQRRSQGRVVPDSFTHGSSEQRQRWFSTGLKSGTVGACNTFAATQL
jgi:predicted metalloprotease